MDISVGELDEILNVLIYLNIWFWSLHFKRAVEELESTKKGRSPCLEQRSWQEKLAELGLLTLTKKQLLSDLRVSHNCLGAVPKKGIEMNFSTVTRLTTNSGMVCLGQTWGITLPGGQKRLPGDVAGFSIPADLEDSAGPNHAWPFPVLMRIQLSAEDWTTGLPEMFLSHSKT